MTSVAGSHTRAIYGLIRDGRLPAAVERLQGVLRVSPGSRAALSLLAHCYYHLDEFEAAAATYEALTQRCPGVPEYRLHWAQALCKAGRYGEAARTATSVEGQEQAVRQLQAAIQYEAGDLRGCRAALEVLGDAAADPAAAAAAAAAAGCVLYKEGRWAEAAQQFVAAAQAGGYTPELAYSLAACQYRGGNLAGAAASLAQVVEAGVQQHPELGIGTQTEGMEARSVGNSGKLKATALVEAFNLRAALELQAGSPEAAAAALSDMPPRAESELDPVTLHNQALVALALGSGAGAGAGAGACASAAFDKLAHLLAHPPFPPELLGNLLSLCCRPEGSASSAGAPGLPPSGRPSAGERAALAQRLLEDPGLAPAVAAHVPADLLPLYEAMCVARAVSAEAALLRLDALAGQRVEALRKRVKAVQDARWAGDQAGAAAGLEAYEAALDAYMPVLMCQAQLHWEAGAYGRCQEALQRSAEFCSDTPAWRLNLAHSLVAQEGGPARLAEAAELYESLLSHFAGGGDAGPAAGWPAGEQESVDGGGQGAPPPPAPGGSLLDVPPPALANLCVCYVVGAQNEAAEELLRRLEEEVGAAEEAAAAAAAAGAALPPPPPHLAVTNLAIGTLYCSKGNFEFGISRVMRGLEPLPAGLDAPRWRAAAAALLALLDAAAKHMVALKDSLVADLLAWLEDVEQAGRGMVVAPPPAPGRAPQTVWSQARALRALLMKMHD